MSKLVYKTRGNSSPRGKPRVYFCAHPDDYRKFFDEISEELLAEQNCAVWYLDDPTAEVDREAHFADLREMQLFVMPVTTRLLTTPNRALEREFFFAIEHHIPVLPLMQEDGLVELFNRKCGDLQFLSKNQQDATALPYKEKLKQYLSSVLVGDELAEKVRAAFDAYVFLSYRKKDRRHAQELMRLIHKNDFCRDVAIWYDEFLTPGEDFNGAIETALEKSGLFAMVVTPNLVNEENYVQSTEFPRARELDKPILAAEMVETNRGALTEQFRGLEQVTDGHDEGALTARLTEMLKGIAISENNDDPEHNFFIGLAYLHGIDVEVDHERALFLITSAAEAGVAEAAGQLAAMYRNGVGVERDYDTAIEWQERKISLCRAAYEAEPNEDRHNELVWALIDCGNDYQEIGNADASMDRLKEANELCESLDNKNLSPVVKRNLVVSYIQIGFLKRMEGENLSAAESFFDAADLLEKSESMSADEKRLLAITYDGIATGSMEDELYEDAYEEICQAVTYFEELLEGDGSVDAKRDLAKGLGSKALVCLATGNYEEATEQYERVLVLRKAVADEERSDDTKKELASAYNTAADYYRLLGNHEKAWEHFMCAKELFEALAEKENTVDFCRALASFYEDIGCSPYEEDGDEELKNYFFSAMDIRVELAERTESGYDLECLASIYDEVGLSAMDAEQFWDAEEYYRLAFETKEKWVKKAGAEQAKLALLDSYNNLCDTYVAREKWEDAKTYYRDGIAFGCELTMAWNDINARRTMAQMYSGLADAFYEEGDETQFFHNGEEAISLYRDILRRRGNSTDKMRLVIMCNKLGIVYFATEKYEKAKSLFLEVVLLCQQILGEDQNEDAEEMLNMAQGHLEEIQDATSNSLVGKFKKWFKR